MVWESSASCIKVRPARISTSAKTKRSNFERGRFTRASSFSISESQRKSLPGAMIWATSRSVAIELCIVVEAT